MLFRSNDVGNKIRIEGLLTKLQKSAVLPFFEAIWHHFFIESTRRNHIDSILLGIHQQLLVEKGKETTR